MLRFTIATAAIALLAGCSVEHRSDEFVCTTQVDCTGGRVCVDGFCVFGGGNPDGSPGADAMSTADAAPCPAACDSCVGTTCLFDCSATGSCSTRIVCPAGWRCDVGCSGDMSCSSGVDCTAPDECFIDCAGADSCAGSLDCGTGTCTVLCGGSNSCSSGTDCSGSCACDVTCNGLGSCSTAAMCQPGGPCTEGNGCRSGPGQCDTCPP